MKFPSYDSKRVLLVNPNQMKPPVAPLGLDYIGCVLERGGFTVDLLDLCFESSWRHAIDRYFDIYDPIAVGVTIRNTDDCLYLSKDFIIPRIKEVTDYIKGRTIRPIVLGGVGFSVMPKLVMSFLDIDFGIRGDGEWALTELLMNIQRGEDIDRIPGLIYKTDEGYLSNPPVFHELNDLPFAYRDTIDNVRYFNEGGMGGVETKRGCAQKCTYCADPIAKGTTYRLRPPRVIVDEIENLVTKGIDHLHLCDSEFNLPYGHAISVCEEIVARGIGESFAWYTYMSPVPFTEELASLMVRAGCKGIDFGADHGDNLMLRNLGRPFTTDDLFSTALICRKYTIPFMYDLLLGGPGENRESLTKTIQLMKEINPSRVGISVGIRVYPGTGLSRTVMKQGIIDTNPNLNGIINEDLFLPVFYLSQDLGDDIVPFIHSLVKDDERFFFGGGEETETNYNYNDNSVLMDAIRNGYRGAFWDILRRMSEDTPKKANK